MPPTPCPSGGRLADRDPERCSWTRSTAGGTWRCVRRTTCCSWSAIRRGHGQETRGAHLRSLLHHQGIGKGTGLGLSSVYGIVKQPRWPHPLLQRARPGRHLQDLPAGPPGLPPSPRPALAGRRPGRRHETILLVDDEEQLLRSMGSGCWRPGATGADGPAAARRPWRYSASRAAGWTW